MQADPAYAKDVLLTYGKVAVKAQEKTNCCTEIMISAAEGWVEEGIKGSEVDGRVNLKGPLAGIPVSLKDSIQVGGFATSVGQACNVLGPDKGVAVTDGPMVRLLKDAGAVPYVKTALPVSLLSFESWNALWGRALNPHHPDYSPGGSTGGEGALLALGGRIGIGSDVAGSVRVPAAWSGIYSLRCSTGRWPKMGMKTSMPGQEGVPSVFSPMTRTLSDLVYFTKAVIGMEPWKYDYTVHPLAWRADKEKEAKEKKVLRVGLMDSDGVVPPTPAIARALATTAAALTAAGHIVTPINPPQNAKPIDGLSLAAQLLNSDGCDTFNSLNMSFEPTDPGAAQMRFWSQLPSPLRYAYYLWVKYIRRDPIWADLIRDFGHKTATENWALVAKREAFRSIWYEWWGSKNSKESAEPYDFLLTPVNATPALPHKAMANACASCGYTFLWNLLDYTTGIIPVGHVDAKLDALPEGFSLKKHLGNGVARGAWKYYDSVKMAGLPTAVQVVGRRLEEEKVLVYMERVVEALAKDGVVYDLLDPTVD